MPESSHEPGVGSIDTEGDAHSAEEVGATVPIRTCRRCQRDLSNLKRGSVQRGVCHRCKAALVTSGEWATFPRVVVERRPESERFWSKVERGREEDCWQWRGGVGAAGYGVFGAREGAHRAAWRLTYGRVPEGLLLRHLCNNPLCVNPAHLKPGTPRENIEDQVAAERRVALLTPECLAELRRRHASGATYAELSSWCGRSPSVVWSAIRGATYSGVHRFLGGPRRSAEERFWSKVDQSGPLVPRCETPCWIWTGHRDKKGYGVFDQQRSHRWAWAALNGPIPDGLILSHQCDTPACVNPDHMRLTDRAGNNRETWERGRGHQQAEREARREAVIRLKLAGHTYAAIASELGIGRSQVADALEYARQTGQLAGRQPGLVEGGKRVKLTADQVEAVRDAAAREENRANIARRFGISRSQVGNYLTARSRADAPGPRRDRRRPVDAQSVRSAVAEGTPRRRVAEQFGITYEQVGRIVREEAQAGAGGPRYQPPPRADAAAIRIAAASGVSTRELARLHGLSPTHVARILSADAQSDAPGPTRAKRVAVDAVAVCGALAAGRSMAEVAVEFGISAHQVSMIARKKSQAARTAAFEAVVGRSPVKLDAESLRRLYEAHNFQWAAVAADLGFRSSAGLSTAMLRQLGDRPVEWARKQGLPFHAPSASRSTLSTGAFDSLIGVLPDAEVAAQAGCDEEKVRRRRYRLAHARRISAGEGGLEG